MLDATGESTGIKLRRYLVGVWSVAAVFLLTMLATRYVQLDVSAVYLAAVLGSRRAPSPCRSSGSWWPA